MPSGLPAHKATDELLSVAERFQMVKLAIRDFQDFEASSFEIDRKGYTYTSDTMVSLKEQYPKDDFYFILGGDSLMKFHKWVKPDVISAYAVLLAAGRNGYTDEELFQQAAFLNSAFGTRVYFLKMTELSVSSSQIRYYCKMQQYDIVKEMVPETVYQYITEHKLWKYPMN